MSTCPDCGKPKTQEPGVRWEPDTYCRAEFPEGSLAGCFRDTIALLRQKLAASDTNAQGFAKLAFEEGQKSFALEQKLAASERELAEATRLLHLLDNQDARHPDVAAFLDKGGRVDG